MSRSTRALINTQALSDNLETIRGLTGDARIMAVIKANGYGHGIVQVARALRAADAYGVARVDEARALRQAGIEKPVVMLEGFQDAEELKSVGELSLDAVLHHGKQLALLEDHEGKPLRCWLKLDSGMHRLGFPLAQTQGVLGRLEQLDSVAKPVILMTHLACADDRHNPMTKHQIHDFAQAVDGLDLERCVVNSAGLLAFPDACLDWVRPGIMLYGISPFPDDTGLDHGLKPVMTLESTLIAINQLRKDEPVGYGATWRAPEDMLVGVAAIGYGDGYPRHARSGTPVLVNTQRCSIVGRVSMDMVSLDLRNAVDANVGDRVVLWGEGLPIEEIAHHADMIPYELVCGVTPRVEFVYP